jgi:membrane-associated phospholipid phosphatase
VPARPRTAALAALACLAGLAATGVLAYMLPAAHAHDAASLDGFVALGSSRRDAVLERVAHLADPGVYALFAVALVAVALARRRPRAAAAVAVVSVAAPTTTEALKHLLAHPRIAEWLGPAQIASASWPSGHATASMTVALCAVAVAPAVLRPLVAVAGGLFAVGVSFAILVLHWHFPSDIVGGYLCAATWTLGALAVLRRWPDRRREAPRRRTGAAVAPAVALAAAAATAAAAVVLDRPRAWAGYLADRPSFAVAAIAIAALAALLAAVLVHAAGEPRGGPRAR